MMSRADSILELFCGKVEVSPNGQWGLRNSRAPAQTLDNTASQSRDQKEQGQLGIFWGDYG